MAYYIYQIDCIIFLTSVEVIFMLKLVKISFGSAISLFIASLIGLNNATSAGVITLLTIQDTSKETIIITLKRVAAFFVATFLSYIIFYIAGFNAVAFGLFLLLFMVCCRFLKLNAAVSSNAVLVTHYLIKGSMELPFILNEALLLLIGAGVGTLLNLYIPGKIKEIRHTQHILEEDLKLVLLRMSQYIVKEDKSDYTGTCFHKLLADVDEGEKHAYAYMNNTFFQESKYFMEYMQMRRQQCMVLKDIYKKIVSLTFIPSQALQISEFIRNISVSFGESNNARELLDELGNLTAEMKNSSLPVTREEFENRAVLYMILMDLEYFLQLKKEFADSLSDEQIRKYWNVNYKSLHT